MSGAPILKDGDLLSETYKSWIRKQECYFCKENPPSQPHHAPPKGRGRTDDTSTVPSCVRCHRRQHGEYVVVGLSRRGPISEGEQEIAVAMTWRRFFVEATELELAQVIRDVQRHREDRLRLEIQW